jgi:hypothetical protein
VVKKNIQIRMYGHVGYAIWSVVAIVVREFESSLLVVSMKMRVFYYNIAPGPRAVLQYD